MRLRARYNVTLQRATDRSRAVTPLALFCYCALCMRALPAALWLQCRLFARNRALLGAVVAPGVRL